MAQALFTRARYDPLMNKMLSLLVLLPVLGFFHEAEARTVYRCVQNGSVSLATAPEPGSKCTTQTFDDNAAKIPNLWGANGKLSGVL